MRYAIKREVNQRYDSEWSPDSRRPLHCLVVPLQSTFAMNDLRNNPKFTEIVDWLLDNGMNWQWSACTDIKTYKFDVEILGAFLFENSRDAVLCRLSCSNLMPIEKYGIEKLRRWYE